MRSTCLDKPVGGRKGWRLPSVVELTSLMDTVNLSPSLPTGHPFTNVVPGFPYWSATTSAEFSSGAWVADFRNEGSAFTKDKSGFTTIHVWCVRGPMNADAY